jgi:4-hydroxyphenylpyruvate dioxygenase
VIDGDEDAAEPFATDFVLDGAPVEAPVGLLRVDHLAMALPPEALDAWVLFARAVLGLIPHPIIELAEPYGIMRSRAVVDRDRCVRITLNASEGRNSMMMRSLSTFAGPGVHHIAVSCSDIFATVQRLKARGVAFLAAPANYYDDLAARFDVADDLITHLRNEGVLYDRSANAEFLHILTEAFDGRFAFEIVQRSPGYDGHGEANAPTELAAQARRLLVSAS